MRVAVKRVTVDDWLSRIVEVLMPTRESTMLACSKPLSSRLSKERELLQNLWMRDRNEAFGDVLAGRCVSSISMLD